MGQQHPMWDTRLRPAISHSIEFALTLKGKSGPSAHRSIWPPSAVAGPGRTGGGGHTSLRVKHFHGRVLLVHAWDCMSSSACCSLELATNRTLHTGPLGTT